jgi:hypothetical protein
LFACERKDVEGLMVVLAAIELMPAPRGDVAPLRMLML